MFAKSVKFYDAMYHFKDYTNASEQIHTLIQRHLPRAKTVLDVACGTGKHLEQLQHHYDVEGLDINKDMLKIASNRCPGVPFHEGDITRFDLGRIFDVVTCLFSSIGYVKTPEKMHSAVSCMSRHLRPGGVLIIEPWFTPETYWTGKITANFVNEPELKIAWMYTSELAERVSIFDIHFLVGTPQGVEHFVERHEMGLFTHQEYIAAFNDAGMHVLYDSESPFGRGIYVGLKKP